MRYKNNIIQSDILNTPGVLLINLGTPTSPQVTDVRRYLAEFLSDPRLVELPRALWWLILHGIILRTRPQHSAIAYQRIWTKDGSPLLSISQNQALAVQTNLSPHTSPPIPVVLAMRYGSPSIATGLATLQQAGAKQILILPLYPQYSATTTGSVFDAVTRELQTWRWVPELRFIHQYYDNPNYINALANSILRYWALHDKPQRLLFSFHGIPQAYSDAGDPYFYHCQATAQLVAKKLHLESDQWLVAFQSRFGSKPWLTPYTDKQLETWARAKINTVHVICPGFAADCLETLDEIAVENRERFLTAGGQKYGYIPALNTDAEHIAMLTDIIKQNLWIAH